MKGGDDQDSSPDPHADLFGGIAWRTDTYLDRYTPLYAALFRRGISQHDARQMDITLVALTLGIPADASQVIDVPILGPDGERVPATAPPGIKRPKWWRGDKAAFTSSQQAGGQLRVVGGGMGADGD